MKTSENLNALKEAATLNAKLHELTGEELRAVTGEGEPESSPLTGR